MLYHNPNKKKNTETNATEKAYFEWDDEFVVDICSLIYDIRTFFLLNGKRGLSRIAMKKVWKNTSTLVYLGYYKIDKSRFTPFLRTLGLHGRWQILWCLSTSVSNVAGNWNLSTIMVVVFNQTYWQHDVIKKRRIHHVLPIEQKPDQKLRTIWIPQYV